jgi:hypothetical protein
MGTSDSEENTPPVFRVLREKFEENHVMWNETETGLW